MADPTGRTGEVTLVVEVSDAQGADTVDSLRVVQEFNFQVSDHADGVIERAGQEPVSVEELASGLTAVSFEDARFDFLYGADKEIVEYISSNPLVPIEVTRAGPEVFEVSFTSDWPGRFPLHIAATDTDGNTTELRVPVEVYWNEQPFDIRGVAIELNYLGGAGEIGQVGRLIRLAADQGFNFVQITTALTMDAPDSSRLGNCSDDARYHGQCFTATAQQIEEWADMAHGLGMGVMLKPHVWALDFQTYDIEPTDWDRWFADYTEEIVSLAGMAEALGIEFFSVGNELLSSQTLLDSWRHLVSEVRDAYEGPITYSDFTLWTGGDPFAIEGSLDYLGVPFYYPGVGTNTEYLEEDDPTVDEIEANLEDQVADLLLPRMGGAGLPAVATELGRFNHEGAVYDTWGQRAWPLPIDNQEQIDYFEAALRTASRHLEGVFFWSYAAYDDSNVGDFGIDVRREPIEDLIRIWSA